MVVLSAIFDVLSSIVSAFFQVLGALGRGLWDILGGPVACAGRGGHPVWRLGCVLPVDTPVLCGLRRFAGGPGVPPRLRPVGEPPAEEGEVKPQRRTG